MDEGREIFVAGLRRFLALEPVAWRRRPQASALTIT